MPITNLKVIRIVSRSNLNNPCTKFRISMLITNNGNKFAQNRKNYPLTNKLTVPTIIRINRNSRIPK